MIEEYQLLQAQILRSFGGVAHCCLSYQGGMQESDERMAHQLGMEVLLEMHNDRDFEYAELEPDMYGINNRNLGTFVTDVENSFRLVEKCFRRMYAE